MHIGITFDLRSDYLAAGFSALETAEFDRADTIIAIEEALAALGHRPELVGNAYRLAERLVAGESWNLVFNIAEGLYGFGREAQVPALLELYQVPYTFSDSLVMAISLHKAMTKKVLRASGVPTPDFAVTDGAGEVNDIPFEPPYFVKPVAEGTGKGIASCSVVESRQALGRLCRELAAEFRQPVLIERYLPGRELTVGIWGTDWRAEVIGSLEVLTRPGAEPNIHSYLNKEQCETLVEYRLARPQGDCVIERAEQLALFAWRSLGCRDAGRVDIRCDQSGEPMLLEINPLSGLHPTHSDLPILCRRLNIPYLDLIDRIVKSAAERLPAPGSARRVMSLCA